MPAHYIYTSISPSPGVELKDISDGITGRMLRVIIQEGKHRNATLEFEDKYQHTTACCMRLAKPWFGSGRVIAGDSWFASVQSAVAHQDHGLHAILLVKTATAGFPKKELNEMMEGKPVGTTVCMETVYNGKPLYAIAYKEAESMTRHYVATCGTTAYEEHVTEEREDGTGEIKRGRTMGPNIHAIFRAASPKIDIHNMMRQGMLKIERVWRTARYHHRIFGTVGIGMTATNVVLDVINQEGGDGTTTGRAEAAELTYREHIKKLAWALMHNSQLENRHSTATPQGTHGPVAAAAGKRASPCKGGGGGGDGGDGGAEPEVVEMHKLVPYSKWGFPNRYQLSCDICRAKASFCCLLCGPETPVCGPSSSQGTSCMEMHTRMNKTGHVLRPSEAFAEYRVLFYNKKRLAARARQSHGTVLLGHCPIKKPKVTK